MEIVKIIFYPFLYCCQDVLFFFYSKSLSLTNDMGDKSFMYKEEHELDDYVTENMEDKSFTYKEEHELDVYDDYVTENMEVGIKSVSNKNT